MEQEREQGTVEELASGSRAGPGVRWLRPLLVSALAILFAALVAILVQAPLLTLTANPQVVEAGPMPTTTFLVGALGTDVGLLAASTGLFLFFPGVLRLRIERRQLLPALASFAVLFCVNLGVSLGMQLTGEAYLGLPEVPRGWLGAVLVFAATAVAPSAEELFFREALLCRVFAASPRGFAIGVTSAAFGALHWNAGGPLLFVGLTGMGMVLGLLRLRSGSLGASILVHGTNNLAAILLLLVAPRT